MGTWFHQRSYVRKSCQCFSRARGSFPKKNGFNAEAAIVPAISAPHPAKPNECPSTPPSVFIETTMKSKFDFPPARISESAMASRVLRQTRTSMDVININGSCRMGSLCYFLRRTDETDGDAWKSNST